MSKKSKMTKSFGIAATLGLSLATTLSVAAWGPERPTFTMAEPATYPTFNSITDNPTIGDERDFVRVGQINADVTEMGNEVEVVPGKQYLVYIYFHNNASATFNDAAHNNSGVALRTRLSSSYSTILTPNERGQVTATITADNSNPLSVWDEAYFTTKSDKVVMKYVEGSARIYNDWQANNSIMPSTIFTAEGALLGLNALNGVVPGCEEYHGIVTYVLQADEHGGSVDKMVSKDGTEFAEKVDIKPGDEVTFRLTIKNTGDTALTNVTIKDSLPAGLELVPGSVRLRANESTTEDTLSDNILGTGYNLGTVGNGNTIYITYKAKTVGDFDCKGTELTNTATLIYDSEQSTGDQKEDTSKVVVTKENCDDCVTNPDLPECQEIPNTGPLEVVMAAVVIAGIGGGGYYLYRSKKTLAKVTGEVQGGEATPMVTDSTPEVPEATPEVNEPEVGEPEAGEPDGVNNEQAENPDSDGGESRESQDN